MGIPVDRLRSSVRFSLGATTIEAEEVVRRLAVVVERVAHAGEPASPG